MLHTYFNDVVITLAGGQKFRLVAYKMNLIRLKRQFKILSERHPLAWAEATITKHTTVNFMY